MKLRSFGVIFDVDGTLLNSMPLAYAGVCNIFTMSGKPNPTFQEYFSKFRVPYMDFYRQRGIEVSEQQCWDWYHDVAKHSLSFMNGKCRWP
jgi:beta-phosphoglucomutase-like phosphatase (HAD superfamily)